MRPEQTRGRGSWNGKVSFLRFLKRNYEPFVSKTRKHSTGVVAKQPPCGLFPLLHQKFYCQHNWPLKPWWQGKALKICLSTLLEVVDAFQTKGEKLLSFIELTEPVCTSHITKGGLRMMDHTCLSLKALLAKSEWDNLELYWKKCLWLKIRDERKAKATQNAGKTGMLPERIILIQTTIHHSGCACVSSGARMTSLTWDCHKISTDLETRKLAHYGHRTICTGNYLIQIKSTQGPRP